MITSSPTFTLAEKLAIVQALDAVIIVDGRVHNGEINALSGLMGQIDFDSNFLVQARNLSKDQSLTVLNSMTPEKKKALASILEDMAIADGFVHQTETALLSNIFAAIGL